MISDLHKVNESVKLNDPDKLIDALNSEKFGHLEPISRGDVGLYLYLFRACMKKSNSAELWLDDVENVTRQASEEIKNVKWTCSLLVDFDEALFNNNIYKFIDVLQKLGHTPPDNDKDRRRMFEIFSAKKSTRQSPWLRHTTTYGKDVYINVESRSHVWLAPKNFIVGSGRFSIEDIDVLVKKIVSREDATKQLKVIESVVKLQAYARGYLIRTQYARMLHFVRHVSCVVRIQAWWKSVLAQREYEQLLKLHRTQKKARQIKKVQCEDPWQRYKRRVRTLVKFDSIAYLFI